MAGALGATQGACGTCIKEAPSDAQPLGDAQMAKRPAATGGPNNDGRGLTVTRG